MEIAPLPAPLLHALDEWGASHIVHVGGGDGALLARLLRHLPRATGVLCDDEAAVAAAPAVLAAADVDERVDVAPLDPSPAPPGGDVYLVELGRFPDDEADRLLRRCRAAMAAAAHLVTIEPASGRAREALIDLVSGAGFEVLDCDMTEPGDRVVLARPRPD